MSASRLSGATPAPAGQPHRRADADERLVRRRAADRVAGVAAEADRAEVRRDRRRRAAARSGGDAIERVGILRVARKNRADRLVRRERELRHVRLGQDDGAGVLDPLAPGRRRGSRRIPSSDERPVSALQADGLEVVLDDRRDAVERPDRARPALKRRSRSSASASASGLIDDDRVDRRAVLVVGLDATRGTARRASGR